MKTQTLEVKPAGTWLDSLAPHSLRMHRHWPRVERWLPKLGEFFVAQGASQALMAVGGFCLLRWMSVSSYAVFTLAFAIQSAMIAFVDIGFSGAIVPLVGARMNDRTVIGRYVAGARRLRMLLLPFVLAGGLVAFCALGSRQGLNAEEILGLFALVSVTIWFNALSVLYSGPIVIRQDLRYLHASQNAMGLLRVVGYGLGHLMGWLGSLYAIGLNMVLNAGMAGALRRRGRPEIDEPPGNSQVAQDARREILRFVRPQVPVMIFNAVEGQIVVFLISIFGRGAALAETGALTRLNLLFAVTPYFLSWIVEPYFARIDTRIARRRFWQIVLGAMGVLVIAPIVGFLVPTPFLWLLGRHYQHLKTEVGLFLLAGAIGAGVGVTSTLSLARRWVFADAIVWIALFTISLQAVAVAVNDVTRPSGAIAVMIWGNLGSLIAYLGLAVRGQRRESRLSA